MNALESAATRKEELSHRLEWRHRMLEWLMPRIKGTNEEDLLQFVDLYTAAMSQSYAEGIDDSRFILEALNKHQPNRVTEIAIKALVELNAKNKADGV